jgi:hypothetical protein
MCGILPGFAAGRPTGSPEIARRPPEMRKMGDIPLGFQVNFFYREDFIYLYDELLTLGKKYS